MFRWLSSAGFSISMLTGIFGFLSCKCKVDKSVDAAQKKDKFYYDQKHSDPRGMQLK